MKTLKLIFFSFLLIALFSEEGVAQREVYNWQISPYAGLLTLNNDVELPENSNSYSYGIRLERRLGSDFTFGLHLAQLEIDDADQNNVSGGFLSLGYHWDNGYLLSKRSSISIFHKIEAGYMDRYSTFESINQNSADIAFGFENGIKLRFGDRISADLALEILGSKSSLTSGDITENIRYNVWKFGLSYHFGSRKSNYVAPVFVPYDGIPNLKTLKKVDKKAENIWIVKDSIYNTDIKLRTRDSALKKNVISNDAKSKQLSRSDSLKIFMHFDSLYQRRTDAKSAMAVKDTSRIGQTQVESIPDSAFAQVDSVEVNELTSRDSSNQIKSDTSRVLKVDNLVSDTLDEEKSKSKSDTLATRQDSDSLLVQPKSVEVESDTSKTEVAKSNLKSDSVKTSNKSEKSDSLQTNAMETKPKVNKETKKIDADSTATRQKADNTDKIVVEAADSSKTVVPKSNLKSDSVKTSTKIEKSDSLQTGAMAKPKVNKEAKNVYADSTATRQKADNSDKIAVEAADTSAKIKPELRRVDTVYVDREPENTERVSPDKTDRGDAKANRVDTVYLEKNINKNPPIIREEKESKDSQQKDNQSLSKEKSANNERAEIRTNNADNSKSLDRQNSLLEKQNQQIAANQQEIARLKKKNRISDSGKILVAGATGTALGAAVSNGSTSNSDTVYFKSAQSELILDSLQRELAMLKAKYEPDSLNTEDSTYIPNPPIGQFYSNRPAPLDSSDYVGISDSTNVSKRDSTIYQEADSLSATPKSEDDIDQKVIEDTTIVTAEKPKTVTPHENTEIEESQNPAKTQPTASELKGKYPIECNFALNKTSLDQAELSKLDVVISDIKNSNRSILLTGFTDKSGNAAYNLQLSKQRAQSVKDYLVQQGVAANKIEVKGGGVDDGSDSFNSNSRRVEVSVK